MNKQLNQSSQQIVSTIEDALRLGQRWFLHNTNSFPPVIVEVSGHLIVVQFPNNNTYAWQLYQSEHQHQIIVYWDSNGGIRYTNNQSVGYAVSRPTYA